MAEKGHYNNWRQLQQHRYHQPASQPAASSSSGKKTNYFSSGADMLTSLLRVLGALKKSQRAWPEWPNAIWAALPDCRFVVSFFGISIKFSWQHKNNVIKIILHLFWIPAAKHSCSSSCWSLMYQHQQPKPKHLGSLESSLCRHVLSCLSYQKVQQQSRFQTRTTIPSYFFCWWHQAGWQASFWAAGVTENSPK